MLIPKGILEIKKIASKDETRPNLMCVHVEREDEVTPRMTATDGVRLLTLTWSEPKVDPEPADFGDLTIVPGFSANIPADMCGDVARAIPKGDVGEIYRHAWLDECANGTVKMGAGDKTLTKAVQCEANNPEVEFPDWRQVVSSKPPSLRIGINTKLLAELLQVMTRATGRSVAILEIPATAMEPIGVRIDTPDGVHAAGVLMPVRIED